MTVDKHTTEPGGDGGSTENVVRLDWREFDEPSAGIVHAAARLTGLAPTDLPPLHETVETDALSALLDRGREHSPSPVQITFYYAGLRTTASADGDLVVRVLDR